jgi:hypothetical protein
MDRKFGPLFGGEKDEGKEISFQNFVQHYNVLLDEQFY